MPSLCLGVLAEALDGAVQVAALDVMRAALHGRDGAGAARQRRQRLEERDQGPPPLQGAPAQSWQLATRPRADAGFFRGPQRKCSLAVERLEAHEHVMRKHGGSRADVAARDEPQGRRRRVEACAAADAARIRKVQQCGGGRSAISGEQPQGPEHRVRLAVGEQQHRAAVVGGAGSKDEQGADASEPHHLCAHCRGAIERAHEVARRKQLNHAAAPLCAAPTARAPGDSGEARVAEELRDSGAQRQRVTLWTDRLPSAEESVARESRLCARRAPGVLDLRANEGQQRGKKARCPPLGLGRQTHLAHGLVLLLPLRLALLLTLHRRRRGAVCGAHTPAVHGSALGDLFEKRPSGCAGSPLRCLLSDAHGRRWRLVQVPERRGLAEQHRPGGAAHRVGRVEAMAHPLGEARELGIDGVAHRPAQDGAEHR